MPAMTPESVVLHEHLRGGVIGHEEVDVAGEGGGTATHNTGGDALDQIATPLRSADAEPSAS
jgi:hypothetical protein